MRKASLGLFPILAVIAVFGLAANTFAQDPIPTRDKFVISARAGGVNAVTGGASVRIHGKTEWELLTIKEDLETGDSVKTGTDGRVEMLLNPGSYLRLGENSEFELANNSLDNLEIRLLRGTAIVEATGADDSQMQINISTPHTKIAIVRRGLYRLSVVPGDTTELIVRKGRVMLDKTKIGGGNKVVFSSDSSFLVAKLQDADKRMLSSLDTWSRERSKTVAKANQNIRQREIAAMMIRMRDPWFNTLSASSSGFWYFSSRFGCYTFVPYFMGWGSPYGSSYSQAFFRGYCGGCSRRLDYRNNYPAGSTSIPGGTIATGGASTGSVPTTVTPVMSPSPSVDRPRPAALEQRLMRHQDRPTEP